MVTLLIPNGQEWQSVHFRSVKFALAFRLINHFQCPKKGLLHLYSMQNRQTTPSVCERP